MASRPSPSSLFSRLVNVWRLVTLRSDVDNLVLELLGRFSLEKIYVVSSDRESYEHLVTTLLAQLQAIFYVQRLSIPAEGTHTTWHTGFLVSWEVALRSIEFVLQIVAEGRESLWDAKRLRQKHLAEFLLSALRFLTFHPRAPTTHRSRDRKDRFARIHRSIEQVFDSYPGPHSFLLSICKEVTSLLQTDSNALVLPQKLRHELPHAASEMYPLPDCLSAKQIAELVPPNDFAVSWVSQYLMLKDVSEFIVAASIQYAANQEKRNFHLQASSARSRNAVLTSLDNIRLPSNVSRLEMVATFAAIFRVILPDTLNLSPKDQSDIDIHEYDLDAMDSLCDRLYERHVVQRASDKELMHGISQVMTNIRAHDSMASSGYQPARPSLYVVNCSSCHLLGGSLLHLSHHDHPPDPGGEIGLPAQSQCSTCGETITQAREIALVRQTWDILSGLKPDADNVNAERHLPSAFEVGSPKTEYAMVGAMHHGPIPYSSRSLRGPTLSPVIDTSLSQNYAQNPSPVSPLSPSTPMGFGTMPTIHTLTSSFHRSEQSLSRSHQLSASTQVTSETGAEETIACTGFSFESKSPQASNDALPQLRSTSEPMLSAPETRPPFQSPHRIETSPEKPAETPKPNPLVNSAAPKAKSRWRLSFPSVRKNVSAPAGEASSHSSGSQESQKLEEIPLGALIGSTKTGSSRAKGAKTINVQLSQDSTLALFWSQAKIHVWDLGTSAPTMVREIVTESTCILASVAKNYVAYVLGTRDQTLTLKILSLAEPTKPTLEYRIPTSLWCKSMAIDPRENYVVIGFESAVVRFFSITGTEQPREDRLHRTAHPTCKNCSGIETLTFSSDGLSLLAGTRSPKTGVVQVYLWRFPFTAFYEMPSCRYTVPLHESEDNGLTAAIVRSAAEGEDPLICLTTWTQSGTPVLIQPRENKTELRTEISNRQRKIGTRIQSASFSSSGRELALVNEKGHLFQISELNSSPLKMKKLATSKELTAKSSSFGMAYMKMNDEDTIVIAWVEVGKGIGWVRKIPLSHRDQAETPSVVHQFAPSEVMAVSVQREPVELDAEESPVVRSFTKSSAETSGWGNSGP